MTQEEILEGNKLIARLDPEMNVIKVDRRNAENKWYEDGFIYEGFKKGGDIGNIRNCNNLKYHESWDWLIPVCRKLNSLSDCSDWADVLEISICSRYEILDAFRAVVEFIKWYNKNKI